MTAASLSTPDLIDTLLSLSADAPTVALRQQRDKVRAATQGSHDTVFAESIAAPTLAQRLAVAQRVAEVSGDPVLAAHYAARLAALPGALAADAALDAQLAFATVLAEAPANAGAPALAALQASGLNVAGVIALAQLIAFLSYQVRVIAGVRALAEAEASDAVPTAPGGPVDAGGKPWATPQVTSPDGTTLQINGYVNRALTWASWLPVLNLDEATPLQQAVLDGSHPKAKTSDYYLLLAHQPEILRERQVAFNAIMYAPGGLNRAERELAATVASRLNRCVYCASVHAERFEQLAKRNDVIAQVFTDPAQAGTTPREQAIVRASASLTEAPASFDAAVVQDLRANGLNDLEILDVIHAVAVFGWANRLMLNLGAPTDAPVAE